MVVDEGTSVSLECHSYNVIPLKIVDVQKMDWLGPYKGNGNHVE